MAFAAYWRSKSRPPGGRPRIGKEVRDLIRRMSFENRRLSGLRGKSPRRFPGTACRKYLIRDNDRAFAGVFKARVRANRPTSFRASWQNGYIERLIGSIRRECTDHLIVVNAEHLRNSREICQLLRSANSCFAREDAPYTRPIARFGDIIAHPVLGGLHDRYARI